MHRVAITSHSDCALRSPAGRSHVRRWLQQETLTILLQARACVATLRVPAEKGRGERGAFHQSPSPRSLLLAVGSSRTALWYFYDVQEGGACWGGQEVLNRRNAPEDSPLGPFEGGVHRNPAIPHRPGVFVWARRVCVAKLSAARRKTRFDASCSISFGCNQKYFSLATGFGYFFIKDVSVVSTKRSYCRHGHKWELHQPSEEVEPTGEDYEELWMLHWVLNEVWKHFGFSPCPEMRKKNKNHQRIIKQTLWDEN